MVVRLRRDEFGIAALFPLTSCAPSHTNDSYESLLHLATLLESLMWLVLSHFFSFQKVGLANFYSYNADVLIHPSILSLVGALFVMISPIVPNTMPRRGGYNRSRIDGRTVVFFKQPRFLLCTALNGKILDEAVLSDRLNPKAFISVRLDQGDKMHLLHLGLSIRSHTDIPRYHWHYQIQRRVIIFRINVCSRHMLHR